MEYNDIQAFKKKRQLQQDIRTPCFAVKMAQNEVSQNSFAVTSMERFQLQNPDLQVKSLSPSSKKSKKKIQFQDTQYSKKQSPIRQELDNLKVEELKLMQKDSSNMNRDSFSRRGQNQIWVNFKEKTSSQQRQKTPGIQNLEINVNPRHAKTKQAFYPKTMKNYYLKMSQRFQEVVEQNRPKDPVSSHIKEPLSLVENIDVNSGRGQTEYLRDYDGEGQDSGPIQPGSIEKLETHFDPNLFSVSQELLEEAEGDQTLQEVLQKALQHQDILVKQRKMGKYQKFHHKSLSDGKVLMPEGKKIDPKKFQERQKLYLSQVRDRLRFTMDRNPKIHSHFSSHHRTPTSGSPLGNPIQRVIMQEGREAIEKNLKEIANLQSFVLQKDQVVTKSYVRELFLKNQGEFRKYRDCKVAAIGELFKPQEQKLMITAGDTFYHTQLPVVSHKRSSQPRAILPEGGVAAPRLRNPPAADSLFNDFLKFGNSGRVVLDNMDENSIKDQRLLYQMHLQRRKSGQREQGDQGIMRIFKGNGNEHFSITKQVELTKQMRLKHLKDEEMKFNRHLHQIAELIEKDALK